MTLNRQPIQQMTPSVEGRVKRSPLLNIDTFIIPSPYIRDAGIEMDYEHSYYWDEEGEILGCIQVYSNAEKTSFHIYKIVTSPFSRGRGIGTMFIEYLASNIPEEASVYLYVWEKQPDTMEYFKGKGFSIGETLVYRNLVYYHLSATPASIREAAASGAGSGSSELRSEDIGKARHDARKTIRFLSHMVDSLSIANSGKIIEDINRETTTLVNILNRFRDTVSQIHEVNLRDVILERIIPYVEVSSIPCRLHLSLDSESSVVLGYYENISRALVNIVANALEAIREKGERGILHIDLRDRQDTIVLRIKDNGIGLSQEMLLPGPDGLPAFVGKSTKGRKRGEGLGSVQIFSVFGRRNISIKSSPGNGAIWTVTFPRPPKGAGEKLYAQLERRYQEFLRLVDVDYLTVDTPRTGIISYIWHVRKMELFLFDLILQFSRFHNIRTIYRVVLSYLQGALSQRELKKEISGFRAGHPLAGSWLFDTVRRIRERLDTLGTIVSLDDFRSQLFRSYGQAIDNVIIFTLDPETGNFLATDRKLAEHLDFAPYLGKTRDELLRGEFIGDLNNHQQAITLGVWSIVSDDDLKRKLLLLQQGAVCLLELGVHREKKLSFYQTTYVRSGRDIDPDYATSVGDLAVMDEKELYDITRQAEADLEGYISFLD